MPFPAARISNQKQNAKGSLPRQGGELAAVLLGTDPGGLFEGFVEVAVVVVAHPLGNLHDFDIFIHELLGPANPLFNDVADEGRTCNAFKELADICDAVIILLRYLLENKERVISRESLLDHVWGFDFVGETNAVDVYIRFLRAKIDEHFGIKLIHTVRGVGYVIREEGQ